MPKVSVVIPIYKAESYIERCARALFGQTLDDLEYIFVNDCSPDKSIEILENVLKDFPYRKDQIKIINNEVNLGVSVAREHGVRNATGEYIIHCDPDDWVELNMYETLYNEAKLKSADIVICDFYNHYNGLEVLRRQRPKKLDNITILEYITGRSQNKLHGSLWNKLIKSSCYSNVIFPNVNFCEDVTVLFQILSNSLSIRYVPLGLYHYKIDTPESLVKKCDIEAVNSNIRLINILEGFYKKEDIRYNNCIDSMITSIIYKTFLLNLLNDDEFKCRFKNYNNCIIKNRNYGLARKVILKFAINGHYHLAYRLYQYPHNLMRIVKRFIYNIAIR